MNNEDNVNRVIITPWLMEPGGSSEDSTGHNMDKGHGKMPRNICYKNSIIEPGIDSWIF